MGEPTVRFQCSVCRKALVARAAQAGRRVECPACGKPLVIPNALAVPEEAPSPAPAAPAAAATPVPPSALRNPAVLFGFGVAAALAAGALITGNVATRLVVLAMLLSALNGFWLGGAKVAAMFIGLVLALPLALPLGHALDGVVGALSGQSGLLNRLLSITIAGGLVITVIGTVLAIPLRRWLKKRPMLRRFDRVAGAGLGLGEGAIFGMLLLWAALAVEPLIARNVVLAREPDSGVVVGPVERVVMRVADAAHESVVGQAAESVNPLANVRLLTLFADVQAVMNDPVASRRFRAHPAMQRLRARPAVQELLDYFAEREDLAGGGLSGAEMKDLLQDEGLLRLFDEIDLAAELPAIAAEIRQALDDARRP